jgi:hypothetical protein
MNRDKKERMTTIIQKNGNRILIPTHGPEVNINNGDIIRYTGNYYKTIRDIVDVEWVKIETTFIGVVESCRSRYETGIQGIYVKPLYIWDIGNSEWYKIHYSNPRPKSKYFLYPHLLMLPEHQYSLCYNIIYSLDTCENTSLEKFRHIEKTFDLYA